MNGLTSRKNLMVFGVVVIVLIVAIMAVVIGGSNISGGSNVAGLTKTSVSIDIDNWSGKKHNGRDYLGLSQGTDKSSITMIDAQMSSKAISYLNFEGKVGSLKFDMRSRNTNAKTWFKFRSGGKVMFQIIEKVNLYIFSASGTMYNMRISTEQEFNNIVITWDTRTGTVSTYCNGNEVAKDISIDIDDDKVIDSILWETEVGAPGHDVTLKFEQFDVWN